MEENLITGIIYSEIDDTLGPNPILWIPSNIPEDIKMNICIKTSTLLAADKGHIPASLVVLPFPSLNLKGITKYIQIRDETQRGGVKFTIITLLFKEFNDVIFYKGMEHFDSTFNHFAQKIIKFEEFGTNREKIYQEIEHLHTNVLTILKDLRTKEYTEAFPEKIIKKEEAINYQFKIIVCGDPMVGKTSLILRFTENAFKRTYISTLGVHVSDRVIRFKNSNIQLVIWDLAGQSKFDVMRTAFYQGAKGVLLVFDLTNAASFNSIKNWFNDVKKHTNIREKLIGFILGNKSDLHNERVVTTEQASKVAKELSLIYFETSALTGNNVANSFKELAEALYLINK
ncbi:MAG: Rab family GTPase [Candidatus Hodarchaeota archaeon]